MKKAFTLIELLVVIAMLAILIGAVGSGVNQARRRAMISKATQDAKEITNAILAFENYAKGHTLEKYVTGGWKETTEGALSMVLGGESGDNNVEVPVLYNAQIVSGAVRDPWGTPYQFMIKRATGDTSRKKTQFYTAPNLPNFYRLTDEERQ